MKFRIMQLQYEASVREGKIVDGFEMWLSSSLLHRNTFGSDSSAVIQSSYTPGERRLVTTVYEYDVKDLNDGFKEITLNISDHASDYAEVEEEKAILLMIGNGASSIEARNLKKIAGRYPEEGIFVLEPNDKIIVTRGDLTEEFIAVKLEKKMYLIKVHN